MFSYIYFFLSPAVKMSVLAFIFFFNTSNGGGEEWMEGGVDGESRRDGGMEGGRGVESLGNTSV